MAPAALITSGRAGCTACGGLLLAAAAASADEGATGVWVSGQFSSFAAVPSSPGFSFPLVYYHASQSASASREFLIGGELVGGIDVRSDLAFFNPTWSFPDALLGGQLEVTLAWAAGNVSVRVDGVLSHCTGTQCTPVVSGGRSSTQFGGSDIGPLLALKWTHGNHYNMAYLLGNVPTGAYEVDRLANIGLHHWAIDGGYGYSYLDEQKGHDLSVVAGVTYNFENPATDYRNGLDSHLDFAASQFLNEHWHVGLVGYAYYQLSADSGSGAHARLGGFQARVFALGPEAGFSFPMKGDQAYLSLRGYWEFGAKNRPEGWNAYLTCALPIGGK
ncbi:MAG TPA: transporter [Steroidobacteraceae bacterium]|nr:transporter [Steroidobacteraceae bacterium]